MDNFTKAYLECALWASHMWIEGEDNPDPLEDHLDIDDLPTEVIEEAKSDCDGFRKLVDWNELEDADDTRGGHDFFLTREGHGAGFWDGDWPEPLATTLTQASKAFGGHDWHGCDMVSAKD